ncbi:hypothetical protein QQF64_036423 [Cirrhinus molitorella]|uniref:Uncharacterized protein n=1 Tax=Cirrhinus molitorella TaxID=172907 RepID=A0ABR3NIM9_9TELE
MVSQGGGRLKNLLPYLLTQSTHPSFHERARRPTETQMMADLPANRLEPSPPFSYCGMDCFGPFLCKQGGKENKRYGLIFTFSLQEQSHRDAGRSHHDALFKLGPFDVL